MGEVQTYLTPTTIAALIGLAVPLLVSLLSKSHASDGIKVILNLVLTALGSVALTIVGTDGGFDFPAFINAWVAAFVTSVTAYYGAYKPSGLAPGLQTATGSFGFGPSGRHAKTDSTTPTPPEGGGGSSDEG